MLGAFPRFARTGESKWSIPEKSVHGMFQAVISKEIMFTRKFCVEAIQLDKMCRVIIVCLCSTLNHVYTKKKKRKFLQIFYQSKIIF